MTETTNASTVSLLATDFDAAAAAASQVALATGLSNDIPSALAMLTSRVAALESALPAIETAVADFKALANDAEAAIPASWATRIKSAIGVIERHFPGQVAPVPTPAATSASDETKA